MAVIKLTTQNFRNLKNQSLLLHPDINFILGDNGSGKSSLLEAIFFLGHGKSFRTNKTEFLAKHEFEQFIISTKSADNNQLGISKNIISGATEIKLNGERLTRLSDLAKHIAVQVVTPESFKVFFGGPKERRRFFDLGLFHVKQQFVNHWRDFNRVLVQRNACLRSPKLLNMLDYWTEEFCKYSELIAELRVEYLTALRDELAFWLKLVLPEINEKINIQYLQGWSQQKSLLEILQANRSRELELGYSISGAHKFDIRFVIGRNAIENSLSRGQQKLFLLALTLAQAKLIEDVKRVKPILLIDDVGAELDLTSREALSTAIKRLDCQIIISAIEKDVLGPLVPKDNNYKMFHVEHGEIIEIN